MDSLIANQRNFFSQPLNRLAKNNADSVVLSENSEPESPVDEALQIRILTPSFSSKKIFPEATEQADEKSIRFQNKKIVWTRQGI